MEAFSVLIKFKMISPWKPRYQNNGVGWCPLLLCNGNSSYYYVTPNAVGWRIAILRFFFTIITSPEHSRVTYCYSTFLFHYYYYYYYYSSTHFCLLDFSEMPWSNFTKLCRNIHRSVWQLLGVEKIQNGCHCHGNQGAKNVKFTPNFTNFCSSVSCHIHI